MLNWKGDRYNQVATGHRGVYTIQQVKDTGFVLQATGHDGLRMADLPILGAVWPLEDLAKDHAEMIERSRPVESQVSGT